MKPQASPVPQDLPAADPRAWLSALADGEADAAEGACAQWRDDPQARRTWYAYHLIGDVMRSEDLAAPTARDAAFLDGVRARLAAEPVVLAPAPVAAPPARRRQPWLVPAAAAAGFFVVAGVLVVTRISEPQATQAVVAAVPAPQAPGPVVDLAVPPTVMVAQPESGQVMLRDPRLAEFERAHRLVRGGLAVGTMPMGALRPVDMTVPAAPAR